ncbi:hypothetical protein T484DRAFT_1765010 [Baffinella frigidus]|nr:hypothetical protein T484DRAFT_1765010 [Cryptophyta sp. CCMP2293]
MAQSPSDASAEDWEAHMEAFARCVVGEHSFTAPRPDARLRRFPSFGKGEAWFSKHGWLRLDQEWG